jgi:hypothetical protein
VSVILFNELQKNLNLFLNKINIKASDFMLCKYESRRIEIVEEYDVVPIAHVKLLPSQTKRSCTNRKLKDKYYCFSYVHKKDKNKNGTFLCGSHAATHFLKLLNHEGLPLFNPLSSEGTNPPRGEGGAGRERNIRNWHPVAQELSDAINLLIIYWDVEKLQGPLGEIKKKVEAKYYREPGYFSIKGINTMIGGRGQKKNNLSNMLKELRKDNPTLREYDFSGINAILKEKNEPSYFS